MSYVPKNTFVYALSLPPGAPITSDPFEFSGSSVHSNLNRSCPQPFSSNVGSGFCSAVCINSCPELNPDATSLEIQELRQNQTILSFVGPAIQATNAALGLQTAVKSVKGTTSFPIPPGTSSSVVSMVISNIVSQLPLTTAYPLTISVCRRYHFMVAEFNSSRALFSARQWGCQWRCRVISRHPLQHRN